MVNRRKKSQVKDQEETQAVAVEEKTERSMDEILAENEELTRKLNTMSEVNVDPELAKYMGTMNSIRSKARVETDKIVVREITDHKNISLWTKDGKRIGPMHRDNALKTFQRFWNLGIKLQAEQPTPAEIEAYKQTPEYKKAKAEYDKKRALKEKSRSKGRIEEYIKQIAAMSGQTVDAIHNILKSNEIRPLSAGQSAAQIDDSDNKRKIMSGNEE